MARASDPLVQEDIQLAARAARDAVT